jgi:hypothetical protein
MARRRRRIKTTIINDDTKRPPRALAHDLILDAELALGPLIENVARAGAGQYGRSILTTKADARGHEPLQGVVTLAIDAEASEHTDVIVYVVEVVSTNDSLRSVPLDVAFVDQHGVVTRDAKPSEQRLVASFDTRGGMEANRPRLPSRTSPISASKPDSPPARATRRSEGAGAPPGSPNAKGDAAPRANG